MGDTMNKEQVVEATIGVLSDISVPIRLKEQIATPIEGAINNLVIVLQMIRVEREAMENQQQEPEQGGTHELMPDAVGCPEDDSEPGAEPIVLPVNKEAADDEPEVDPE